MCGIAGIVGNTTKPGVRERLLRRMLGLIRHRGPDSLGIYTDPEAGLGSARLSIIDLAGGDQPVHNEDKSVWIVFNGEIFNYPEIRAGLEKRGHRFYTDTDTEVLVHLYEEESEGLFRHLNGQFAFAIRDRKNKSLLLGRDRLGIRPLYYTQCSGELIFASEIKSIFARQGVPRAIDRGTLSDIFICWAPLGDATPFEGVRQLPPGSFGVYRDDRLDIKPYWKLQFPRKCDSRPFPALLEEMKELLRDATRIRLRADVPVGAYLSGGLDSSYITSTVKKSFNNRLRTFSISFADERFDETAFQNQAKRWLETDHSMIRCGYRDIGEQLPDVVWHTETPILRTAPVPMYMLAKLVRDSSYKVVLTGEGSDEIFGGYDIFKEDRVRRYWAKQPDSIVRPLLLRKLYPDIDFGRGRASSLLLAFFRKGLTATESPAYSHFIRWENTSRIRTFLADDILRATGGLDDFIGRFTSMLPEEFGQWEPFSRAQFTEISIFLSNYLLCSQGDRVAMGHSVEGRFPFLDYRVVEFASSLPSTYCLNALKDKYILRQAALEILPESLVSRPKQPYRAPISQCFLGQHEPEYVQDALSPQSLADTGLFNPAKVGKLVRKCRRLNGSLMSERENMAVVGIISAQLLHRKLIRDFPGNPPEPDNVRVFRLN